MKSPISLSLLALSLTSGLWGCGGGGGGQDSGSSISLSSSDFVAVTGAAANLADETTARKVAAAAANQMTNSGAGNLDTGLLTGAETGSSSQPKGVNDLLARLPQWLTSSDNGVLSAAETRDCAYGGSITVSSNSQSRLVLSQGTMVTLSADRCTEKDDGVNVVIHGSLNAVVARGSISASGTFQSNTRLNFEFNQFQMNYSEPGENGAVGLDGGLSIAYSGFSNSSFTSTPLSNRPTLTTVIRHNDTQVRHTISDFQLTYSDSRFVTEVSGFATVNSNTASLGVPNQYRWRTSTPLTSSNDRITSGTLLLTTQSNDPSVTVRFGQSCVPSGTGCVTIQRTINSVPQPIQTLTWAQFEALSSN